RREGRGCCSLQVLIREGRNQPRELFDFGLVDIQPVELLFVPPPCISALRRRRYLTCSISAGVNFSHIYTAPAQWEQQEFRGKNQVRSGNLFRILKHVRNDS